MLLHSVCILHKWTSLRKALLKKSVRIRIPLKYKNKCTHNIIFCSWTFLFLWNTYLSAALLMTVPIEISLSSEKTIVFNLLCLLGCLFLHASSCFCFFLATSFFLFAQKFIILYQAKVFDPNTGPEANRSIVYLWAFSSFFEVRNVYICPSDGSTYQVCRSSRLCNRVSLCYII